MGTFRTPEVVELKKLSPENHPLIELLRPESTTQLFCDIDLALLDDRFSETPRRVEAKVELINQALLQLAQRTGKQILFSLVTQKPCLVFSHPDTASIYSPLLNINSIRHGKTDGIPCLVTLPSSHVYCEFGAVTRIQNNVTGEIITRIGDSYRNTFALLREFENILNEHFLYQDEVQLYQLEPGNLAYTAIQVLGGRPMPLETKQQLTATIKQLLKKLGREDILNALDFTTAHSDLDCTPHALSNQAKAIGVQTDIASKHYQGYPWFNENHLVIVDDKWHAAGTAAKAILEKGGGAITPSNGDPQLKGLLAGSERGFVSAHPTFLGVLDGLHWLTTAKPLTPEKIAKIEYALAQK